MLLGARFVSPIGHRRREWWRRSIQSALPFLLFFLSANGLTITTFNILAPVHRSMNAMNHRESSREEWWRPRAEGVATYISTKFASSDVILLQEWWFDEKFTSVFDSVIGENFYRIAERRPSGEEGKMRDDGMCCLVRKSGNLELVKSEKVSTGPQRIAQIIQCKERCSSGEGRSVFIANSHLSFPGDADPAINSLKQAKEASISEYCDSCHSDCLSIDDILTLQTLILQNPFSIKGIDKGEHRMGHNNILPQNDWKLWRFSCRKRLSRSCLWGL